MTNCTLPEKIRFEFGSFWLKAVEADGIELNSNAVRVIRALALEAADRIDELEAENRQLRIAVNNFLSGVESHNWPSSLDSSSAKEHE